MTMTATDNRSATARTARSTTTAGARRAVAAWVATAGRERLLQLGLGTLWLADGALQLQPAMFTRHFVTGVVLPAAAGNPAPVAAPITALGHLMVPHVVLFNAVFAAVQLAIGALLLARRAVRATLGASLAWVLGVWWLGEGFGGLLTGAASPLSGAPGAVALYGLVALFAWPARPELATRRSVRVGLLGPGAARLAVAGLWALGAGLLLQPANLAPGALSGELVAAAGGEPAWLADPIGRLAHAIGAAGRPVTLALAATMLLVALGFLVPRLTGAASAVAVLVSLAIWVFAQALGGIATGTATDPNSGPLLALLAVALLGRTPAPLAQRPPALVGRAAA